MGLRNYLVEGVSGTGKTAVCHELGIVIDASQPLADVVNEILRHVGLIGREGA